MLSDTQYSEKSEWGKSPFCSLISNSWMIRPSSSSAARGGRHRVHNVAMRLAMLILVWGSMADRCSSQEVASEALEPVLLQEIQFSIDHDTAANQVVAKLAFEVHERAKSALGEATLEWNPVEFLRETRLVRIGDDQTPPAPKDPTVSLTIGEDARSDFVLGIINRGRIRKGQPAELSLSVPRPDTFLPGIYRGKLQFRFSAPEQLNVDIIGNVPITVAVRGLRLVDFKFNHAMNGQVRFGSPADVSLTIDTFGCELKTGKLQFSQQPIESAAPQTLQLSIPFSKNEFKDPKLTFKPNSYPASWSKNAFWTETSESSDVAHSAKVPPQFCEWKRHTVVLHLGECHDLGTITGGVSWPQAEIAPGPRGNTINKEVKAEVTEGLEAIPRLAFLREKIHLTLASRTDLGASIKVIIVDEEKKNPVVELKRSGPRLNEDGSKVNVTAQVHLYKGSFSEKRYGTYLLRFPAEVLKQHQSLQALESAAPEIRVWLALRDTTQAPLRVFASATPFWWGQKSDPFKGSGWREKRPGMLNLEFDKNRLSDVSVKLVPTSPRPLPPVGTAPPPELDPQLTIESSTEPSRNHDKGSDSVWTWTGLNSSLALQGEVSFPNHDAVKKRPVIGIWKIPFRMQIGGTTNGTHVLRLVELTIPVEVTTEWVYYRRVIWWFVGAVALFVALFWMYRKANPRIHSSRRSLVNIVTPPSRDGLADFMSTVPSNPKPTSSTGQPVAPEKRPTAVPEPLRRDSIDDFLK